MTSQAADHRRATAERNVAAILDAAAELHQAAFGPVGALAERGQADGSFRADVPASWLVTSFFALIHACAGEVRARRLEAGDAQRALIATVTDLFAGGRR